MKGAENPMLFSEKLSEIPQPDRAALWEQYTVLCTALSLRVKLKRENRPPSEEEMEPLKKAATQANRILRKHSLSPSFFPDDPEFYSRLLLELDNITNEPLKKGD